MNEKEPRQQQKYREHPCAHKGSVPSVTHRIMLTISFNLHISTESLAIFSPHFGPFFFFFCWFLFCTQSRIGLVNDLPIFYSWNHCVRRKDWIFCKLWHSHLFNELKRFPFAIDERLLLCIGMSARKAMDFRRKCELWRLDLNVNFHRHFQNEKKQILEFSRMKKHFHSNYSTLDFSHIQMKRFILSSINRWWKSNDL